MLNHCGRRFGSDAQLALTFAGKGSADIGLLTTTF